MSYVSAEAFEIWEIVCSDRDNSDRGGSDATLITQPSVPQGHRANLNGVHIEGSVGTIEDLGGRKDA